MLVEGEKQNEAIQNTVKEAQQLILFDDGDNAGGVRVDDERGVSNGTANRGQSGSDLRRRNASGARQDKPPSILQKIKKRIVLEGLVKALGNSSKIKGRAKRYC